MYDVTTAKLFLLDTWNSNGNIVLRFLLQQGEDNSLLTAPLADHGVTLPMTFLDAQSCDLRSLRNV